MNYSVIGNDVVPTITISNWEFSVRFALFLLFIVALYLIEETNKIFKRVDLIPLRERRLRLIRLLNQDRDEEIKRINEEYDMKIRNLPPIAEQERQFEEQYDQVLTQQQQEKTD